MNRVRDKTTETQARVDDSRPRSRLSQHEDVDECTDEICCCEAEPRWRRLAEANEEKATEREK